MVKNKILIVLSLFLFCSCVTVYKLQINKKTEYIINKGNKFEFFEPYQQGGKQFKNHSFKNNFSDYRDFRVKKNDDKIIYNYYGKIDMLYLDTNVFQEKARMEYVLYPFIEFDFACINLANESYYDSISKSVYDLDKDYDSLIKLSHNDSLWHIITEKKEQVERNRYLRREELMKINSIDSNTILIFKYIGENEYDWEYAFHYNKKEKVHVFNVYIKSEEYNYHKYSQVFEVYISSKNGLPLEVSNVKFRKGEHLQMVSKEIQSYRKLFLPTKRRFKKILM